MEAPLELGGALCVLPSPLAAGAPAVAGTGSDKPGVRTGSDKEDAAARG